MTTKLKIDLSQGVLEVEGSEAFVRNIYADFKAHFAGVEDDEAEPKPVTRRTRKTKTGQATKSGAATKAAAMEPPAPAVSQTAEAEPPPPAVISPPEPAPEATPKPAAPIYTYLSELNLKANKDRPALVEFMDSKFPITNEERNIVFLYYLQHLLNLKQITVDHIYTCFREAKIRAPLNIQKSLDHDEWVKIAKNGNLSLTPAGKKYVEQNLPKKLKY